MRIKLPKTFCKDFYVTILIEIRRLGAEIKIADVRENATST
jgi:hypothetical protein